MSNEVENNEVKTPEAAGYQPQTPKKKRKGNIIILVVVIVIVLLFGGGGVVYATQHSNPEFCNLVCHTPMDPYVESFMEGTSVNAQQTDLEYPLGVTVHRDSDQGIVCLTCHNDGLGTQISEGISWITGNYSVPLEGLTLTAKDSSAAHTRNGVTTCLQSGCHEGVESLEDLKEATSDMKRNPHESHNGDQDCTLCHQQHEQSIMQCTQCHSDSEVPDGWITYTEYQKQIKEAAAA